MGPTPRIFPPARVWQSAAWMILGRLWGAACTVLVLWSAAQALDDGAFGRLAFWLAAFLVLDALVDLGVGSVTVQRTASDPDAVGPIVARARRVRLVAGALGSAFVTAIVFATGEPAAPWIAAASLYPITHALEVSTLGWRNAIRWRSPVIVRAGAATTGLVLVLALRAAGVAEEGPYLAAIALGSSLGNVALHAFGRRHLPRGTFSPAPLGPFLRAALPLGVAGVAQQAYFHVDNLFVRALEGDAVVGHYNVAVRVMSLGIALAVMASGAALPWLTRADVAGNLRAAATRLAIPLVLVGIALAAVCYPQREALLGLFGEGFDSAAPALTWLLGALVAVHLGAPFLTAVVASGAAGRVASIAIAALLFNVLGNAWLVPARGAEGAAIATFGTELFVALFAWLSILRSK